MCMLNYFHESIEEHRSIDMSYAWHLSELVLFTLLVKLYDTSRILKFTHVCKTAVRACTFNWYGINARGSRSTLYFLFSVIESWDWNTKKKKKKKKKSLKLLCKHSGVMKVYRKYGIQRQMFQQKLHVLLIKHSDLIVKQNNNVIFNEKKI